MLHVILGILKVIGVILLAILCLLFLCLMALLFVPVRYRIAGRKEGQEMEGRIQVSWLLHLLRLTADYREKHLVIRLKLFGFTLKRTGEEKTISRKKPISRKKTTEFTDTPGLGEAQKTGGTASTGEAQKTGGTASTGEAQESGETIPAVDERESGEPIPLREEKGNEETTFSGEMQENEEPAPTESGSRERDIFQQEERTEKQGDGGEERETLTEAKKTLSERIRDLIGKLRKLRDIIAQRLAQIFEFIMDMPERLLDFVERAGEVLDSGELAVEKLEKTREDLLRKAKPFLTDNSKALYKRLWGYLKYLWKCYGPRKIKGWLKFGTGQPDVTGELTGLLYMVLPAAAEDFELYPDFTEAVFETDAVVTGHIRACHVIKIAFLLWRDKQLRGLIRKVRAKGGQKNGR